MTNLLPARTKSADMGRVRESIAQKNSSYRQFAATPVTHELLSTIVGRPSHLRSRLGTKLVLWSLSFPSQPPLVRDAVRSYKTPLAQLINAGIVIESGICTYGAVRFGTQLYNLHPRVDRAVLASWVELNVPQALLDFGVKLETADDRTRDKNERKRLAKRMAKQQVPVVQPGQQQIVFPDQGPVESRTFVTQTDANGTAVLPVVDACSTIHMADNGRPVQFAAQVISSTGIEIHPVSLPDRVNQANQRAGRATDRVSVLADRISTLLTGKKPEARMSSVPPCTAGLVPALDFADVTMDLLDQRLGELERQIDQLAGPA